MATPRRPSPSGVRKRGLAAAHAREENSKVAARMLPPLRPPANWTNGISMPADERGNAKYRVGLKGNPLPEVPVSRVNCVPEGTFRDLVARGLSTGQIARELEIRKESVRKRLISLNLKTDHQKAVEDYKNRKADIFATYQMDILKGITPEKIETAPIGDLTRSFGTLYDRERIERGLSTEIIDVGRGVERVSQIEELQKRVLLRLGIKKEGVANGGGVEAIVEAEFGG